jgi:ABC-type cobalamin/Fe3+-siderophores transport system ATPase subunit
LTEALAARELRFGYGGRPLIEQFSIGLPEGSFTGILGPNGAGKTTLLRLLSGTLLPEAGTVHVFGRRLAALPARERAQAIAVVPQEARVLFPFTCLEIVLMARFSRLGILGMERSSDEELARRCLEEVEMGAAADRPLNMLSSGERQRVLIARALAQQPRVLLLDEPTTYLDLKHRLRTYDTLARLNREQGVTILTISHDPSLVARACRRIVLLHSGRVLVEGTPEEVLTPRWIRSAYGTGAAIARDPRTGSPIVIPYLESESGGAP